MDELLEKYKKSLEVLDTAELAHQTATDAIVDRLFPRAGIPVDGEEKKFMSDGNLVVVRQRLSYDGQRIVQIRFEALDAV